MSPSLRPMTKAIRNRFKQINPLHVLVASAAVEQSSRKANMAAQGDGKFG